MTILSTRSRLYAESSDEQHDELLDLALPLREYNALARFGITYADEVEQLLSQDRHVPGLGAKGRQRMHEALTAFRVRRGETPPPARTDDSQSPAAPVGSLLAKDSARLVLRASLDEAPLVAEMREMPTLPVAPRAADLSVLSLPQLVELDLDIRAEAERRVKDLQLAVTGRC